MKYSLANRNRGMRDRKPPKLPEARIISLAVALALGIASTAALSADSPEDREFERRIYIGASGGFTTLEPKTSNTGFHVGDNSSNGASLVLGYDLTKHWSIEAYAAELGSAQIDRNVDGIKAGDIDYQNFGISGIGYFYNAQRKHHYEKGYDDEGFYRREGLSLFGRLGLGKQDTDSRTVAFRQLEDTALHMGAGVEFGWSNGIAARVEFISHDKDYKYYSVGLLKRFGEMAPYKVIDKPSVVITKPETKLVEKVVERVVEKYIPIPLPVVHFPFDESRLTGVATSVLDALSNSMKPHPDLKLEVSGHTDSRGSNPYNQDLSERRVDSVINYLKSRGIDPTRFSTNAFGEERPADNNSTDDGRANNRRVEFGIVE